MHTYRSQIVEIRGGTVYSYIQVTNKKISGEEQFMHTYYIQVTNSRYQGRNSLFIHTGHKYKDIRGGTVYAYIQVTNSRYQGRNSLYIHTGHK